MTYIEYVVHRILNQHAPHVYCDECPLEFRHVPVTNEVVM